MKWIVPVIFAVVSMQPYRVWANECDCSNSSGECAANISVFPTGSQKGLYGADLKFSTSTQSCAKVEYYIDNTPVFTVLPKGYGEDRVQGSSAEPVTNKRVSLIRCTVCKSESAASVSAPRSSAEEIFGSALESDSTFDRYETENKINKIQAGDNMPSMDSVMGIVVDAQRLQQSTENQKTINAAARSAQAAQTDSKQSSGAATGSTSGSAKQSPDKTPGYCATHNDYRCGVK